VEDGMTPGEAALFERLRTARNWDDWLLFTNAGFKRIDAYSLTARGITEMSEQLGMPAIRLKQTGGKKVWPPSEAYRKAIKVILEMGKGVTK
jgi:hypothetical protein